MLLELLGNRSQYLIKERGCADSRIFWESADVYNAFDTPKDNRHAFVGADCGSRASWQALVQRKPNGTWRCLNEYPRLIVRDDIMEVNLLSLVEHIKERSGAVDTLLSRFESQHVGNSLKMSRFHVQEHGEALMSNRRRQAQKLSNRTNC
jgi:hypothetical protein